MLRSTEASCDIWSSIITDERRHVDATQDSPIFTEFIGEQDTEGMKGGGEGRALNRPAIVLKTSTEPKFSNEDFAISLSDIAGWGAFAVQNLKKGDVILMEKPLFIADWANPFCEFDDLDQNEKDIALSLHKNESMKLGTPALKAVWKTNRHVLSLFPASYRLISTAPSITYRFIYVTNFTDCSIITVLQWTDRERDCFQLHRGSIMRVGQWTI